MSQAEITASANNKKAEVNKTLAAFFIGLCAFELIIKLWMIGQIGLFGDGAFYWLESRYLAPAYSDIPFMTALLVKISTLLVGDSLYGVRFIFVVMGSLIPLLVYWLAAPIAGRNKAILSGIFYCCTPILAPMGVVAVPDVPLLFFSILVIGFFERALRTGEKRFWLALAICGALGFSTHYRFVVLPFAIFIFALTTPSARALFKNPAALAAGIFALSGTLPALWFNLNFDWQSIGFHFGDRHPGAFNSRGLLQPLVQMAIITPLMYTGLIAAAIWGLRQHKESVRLLATCGLVFVLLYAFAAPWADQRSSSAHWPLTGYLPLFVLLPMLLQKVFSGNKFIPFLIASSAFLFLLGFLVYGYFAGNYQKLPIKYQPFVSSKFDGFEQLASDLSKLPEINSRVLVADNYYLGAQIAFHLNKAESIYFLEHDKAFRDGRHAQIYLWQKYAASISEGQKAYILVESDKLHSDEKNLITERICKHFADVSEVARINQFHSAKRYLVLQGQKKSDDLLTESSWCTGLINFEISPFISKNASYPQTENFTSHGWIYHLGSGLESMNLILDGKQRMPVKTHISRADVLQVHPESLEDPNQPKFGFKFDIPFANLKPGWHTLEIEVFFENGAYRRILHTRFLIVSE